jgi:hypothetical protein
MQEELLKGNLMNSADWPWTDMVSADSGNALACGPIVYTVVENGSDMPVTFTTFVDDTANN